MFASDDGGAIVEVGQGCGVADDGVLQWKPRGGLPRSLNSNDPVWGLRPGEWCRPGRRTPTTVKGMLLMASLACGGGAARRRCHGVCQLEPVV